jgi:HEAT repeat protein
LPGTKNILSLITLSLTLGIVPAAQQVRFDDVVRNLRNPDPRARMSSIALLRESKYLEAIEPIAPLVNDPIDEIQLAAIEAELSFFLVEDVGPRKRRAFIVEVRSSGRAESAFDAGPLAVWPRPAPASLVTALLKAVDDEHPKVRLEAIYTLGTVAQAPVAAEHAKGLITALDHYDPEIRAAAARVIGRLQVKSAGEPLINAVNDSQPPVRFAAMRALGDIREETAIEALTRQLEHYRKGEGAWSALDGLARIGHPSSIPVFTARLTDRDAFVRRAAIEGLGRARGSDAIAALENVAVNDSSDMVRAAAAFALQKLGQDRLPTLVAALESGDLALQVSGYFLEIGASAVPVLAKHLTHPEESVRGNAALVLGALGTSADIPTLEPLLQDRNGDVRRAAERAINRIKVRGA